MNKFQMIMNHYGIFRITSTIGLFVVSAALTACGGGSSSGGSGGGGVGISNTNKPPIASSSAMTTAEDTPAPNQLIAIDPDADPLTFSIVNNGSIGTAVLTNTSTGAFTYTPNLNQNGTDNFTFMASDASANSNIATITITVTSVADDPPVANNSVGATVEDFATNGTLSATDPDGDAITSYSIDTNASLGTVVLTNTVTGSYTYTPNGNANGADSFTFTASDGVLSSNIATVSINVIAVNDEPAATNGCGTTPQPSTAGVLPAFIGTLQATDIDSVSLTFSLADGSLGPFFTPKGGEVNITNPTNGEFSYTPKALADGGTRGFDTFNFKVTDTEGDTANGIESVVIDQHIMPLGDSITTGDTDVNTSTFTTVGYRLPLFNSLTSAGLGFNFVGTLNHGTAFAGFDFNHEGHGGWTASDLAWGGGLGSNPNDPNDGIFGWLNSNPSDFILLHAGTNGLSPNGDIDIEVILNEIDRWEASAGGNPVTVLLALIIDQDPLKPEVTTFNNNVRTMANDRIANTGDNIIIVDQQNDAGLIYQTGVDMAEKLHPNASGYDKIASLWFSELTNLVAVCP